MDRAPAGGFLVRRPQVFSAGSKGRTVKARAAARRGSLDRLPAFGTFAGAMDGEAGIFRDALLYTRPFRNEMCKEIRYAAENSPSHVAYCARIPLSVRETIDRVAAMQGRTCTDFLIAAVLEKAEQVIAEQSLVRLALEDQRTLAAALLSEETEAPSSFLEKLSSEHAQRVESR